jgi:hypothetical protein
MSGNKEMQAMMTNDQSGVSENGYRQGKEVGSGADTVEVERQNAIKTRRESNK